jgi:hypothetical protein
MTLLRGIVSTWRSNALEECAVINHRHPHPARRRATRSSGDPPHKGEGKMRRGSGKKQTARVRGARFDSIRFGFQIARETQTTLRTRFDWVPGHPRPSAKAPIHTCSCQLIEEYVVLQVIPFHLRRFDTV